MAIEGPLSLRMASLRLQKEPSQHHCLHVTTSKTLQGGSGTEPEPETGTVGTVFPETERGTGTAGTIFQEPKPEPEPSFPVKLY